METFAVIEDSDSQVQWGYVRLDDVRTVVNGYELWKDASWYHEVDWRRVSSTLDQTLRVHGPPSSFDAVWDQLEPMAEEMSPTNQFGLASLLMEPVTVTRTSLTNGGHRLAAMLRQGVKGVPAMLHRWDIGQTLRPEDVY